MNQLTEAQVQTADGLPVGDQESDCDDDDRRELISHYANDNYLSKWELAEEEENEEDQEKGDNEEPNRENSEEKKADSTKTAQHLVAAVDCDDMSLVSYNSVRDCNPLSTSNTAPPSVYNQLGPLPESTGEGLKLWQGYGGNIYFDAVRCQSMRINSAKYGKTRKENVTKRWKSKSCIQMNRRDGYESHLVGTTSSNKEIPQASTHNLGSLRMKSCKEKKCKTATCRHSEIPKPLPGKICKGFSEKTVTETFQRFQGNGASRLKGEPLAVSGGQVGDAVFDPIDKVRQFNTHWKGRDITLSLESGFPTLLSDSSFFSHVDHRSSTVVTSSTDPYIKFPVLEKSEGRHRKSKTAENGSSGENSKNEPRPVFIIPFGSFDDPVEVEPELKRKAEKREKPSSNSPRDGTNTSTDSIKEAKKSPEGFEDSVVTHCLEEKAADSASGQEESAHSVKHPITTSGAISDGKAPCSSGSVKQTMTDFHLKREISNLSLSNYLKAVPTQSSKGQDSLTSPRSTLMPKMSYTKRSRALPTFYMVNNSLHQTGFSSQRTNASQVYGGYIPTTGRKESKLFYAEISTSPEENPLPSGVDSMQGFSRRTRGSSYKKAASNAQIPFVKASYISRKSFSRQSVERSQRVHNALKSDKNLPRVPVTGHQFSRLNGVNNR